MKITDRRNRLTAILLMTFIIGGTYQIQVHAEETETIRVWATGTAYDEVDMSDNALTRWIQEQVRQELGINVEFMGSWKDGGEDLETRLMKQEGPDIFWVDQENFIRYAKQGLLADLTEAYEIYGDNIRAMGDFQYMGNIDGIQYGLTRYEGLDTSNVIAYIRKDWLEMLGMDVPTTKEELIEYLYAVKEQNPGNMENVVPWAMNGSWNTGEKYLGFIGSYVTLSSERDAYIYADEYMAVAPGALDGIRQMNTLYNDGLISENFIMDSQVAANRYEKQIARGKAGFFVDRMSSVWNLMEMMWQDDKKITYLPIRCFELEDGSYRNLAECAYGKLFICVPAASQDKVKACVRYLNWMADPEVSASIMYGPGYEQDEYGAPIKRIFTECIELDYPVGMTYRAVSLMNRHLNYQDDPDATVSYWKRDQLFFVPDDEWMKLHWDIMHDNPYIVPAFAEIPEAELEYTDLVKFDMIQYVYQLISCAPEEFDSLQEELYRQLEEEGLSKILEGRAAYYDSL